LFHIGARERRLPGVTVWQPELVSSRPLLRELLDSYVTAGLEMPDYFRFHDAPPSVARSALDAVDTSCGNARPNGQPPAVWLVEIAARLGGTLSGQAATPPNLPQRLRIDAVCVAGDRGGDLARAIDRDWAAAVDGETPLALALAEGWTRWEADEPMWTGGGRELLDGPPRAGVVGLWWD
jgi:hypothetical protein